MIVLCCCFCLDVLVDVLVVFIFTSAQTNSSMITLSELSAKGHGHVVDAIIDVVVVVVVLRFLLMFSLSFFFILTSSINVQPRGLECRGKDGTI